MHFETKTNHLFNSFNQNYTSESHLVFVLKGGGEEYKGVTASIRAGENFLNTLKKEFSNTEEVDTTNNEEIDAAQKTIFNKIQSVTNFLI